MSIDADWADAVERVTAKYDTSRPGKEWFSVNEFADKMGWTKKKANNFIRQHSDDFEMCKRGAATWWRVMGPA